MSKVGKSIIDGMKEALAFARGDCNHEWTYSKPSWATTTEIARCKKCGVVVTTFEE